MMEKYGGRTNLEMDYFGGEPLMNWDVVKQLVEYARSVEKERGKNFCFTLTTNGRGFQYTGRVFRQKLVQAGMTQSMSRVAHCTDNGPMEGFWGILKREMYYKKKFHSREELVSAIVEYIDYYRNDRPQRGLGILTPMEYHDMLMAA